jgi:hypothetical protein
MSAQHPITPPPELVAQWTEKAEHWEGAYEIDIATQAARWGADQELEACCEVLDMVNSSNYWSQVLRSDRRPKPPSLKEQALADLDKIESSDRGGYAVADLTAIRRALEALDD